MRVIRDWFPLPPLPTDGRLTRNQTLCIPETSDLQKSYQNVPNSTVQTITTLRTQPIIAVMGRTVLMTKVSFLDIGTGPRHLVHVFGSKVSGNRFTKKPLQYPLK